MGMFPNTELMSVNLPPNDNVLAFQVESLELNLSTISCQFFIWFMLAPKGFAGCY